MNTIAKEGNFSIDRQIIQQMTGIIALFSLMTVAISFYILPGVHLSGTSLMSALGAGAVFFVVYTLLPQVYFNETFLMISDAVYIALITYIATRVGEFGILILFLYFIVIVADALKYPLSEYIFLVLFIIQAAFMYIVLWSPFAPQAKIGILVLFIFTTVSMAVFVWYFAYQIVHERSMRYVLEKKSRYLKTMNEHLKAVNAMRTSIMNVTSHEFQTPLSVVRHSLSSMRESRMGSLSPQQLRYLKMAISHNNEAINLVQDLLSVSRIETGDWKLYFQETDLVDTVKDLVTEFRPVIEGNKVKLVTELPDKPLEVLVDRRLFRIAAKNLIDNAAKYTPAGTVTISLKSVHDGVEFAVSDTGIGMNAEAKTHLFAKFSRADNAILTKPDGFGIGLYYSQLIIQKHKGRIDVESKEGVGSTFTIHLPKSIKVKK